ncbi:hypothetical protein [Nocardia cyriacigeorgica]|uniref:hypothetical protein n=1 Tax=Nocardia cyriacigeorgica TaxID=135487 RepID=UPI0018939D75|nr:hypothetical protein [Nocardia cyriacigeorgica]MBF6413427.1 hypothetical protein [Nocardia cyriacigeorgica]
MTSTYGTPCSNPECGSLDTTDEEGPDFPLCRDCHATYSWDLLILTASITRFAFRCDLNTHACNYDDIERATYYPQWQLQLCDHHHRCMVSSCTRFDLQIQAFEQGQLDLTDVDGLTDY